MFAEPPLSNQVGWFRSGLEQQYGMISLAPKSWVFVPISWTTGIWKGKVRGTAESSLIIKLDCERRQRLEAFRVCTLIAWDSAGARIRQEKSFCKLVKHPAFNVTPWLENKNKITKAALITTKCIFTTEYICVYMYVCVYVCAYIFIYVCMYIYIYIYYHHRIYHYDIYIYIYIYIWQGEVPLMLPRVKRGALRTWTFDRHSVKVTALSLAAFPGLS